MKQIVSLVFTMLATMVCLYAQLNDGKYKQSQENILSERQRAQQKTDSLWNTRQKLMQKSPVQMRAMEGIATFAAPGSIAVNDNPTYSAYTPQQLVENIFVKGGACSSVSNITLNSHGWDGTKWTSDDSRGMGYFSRGNSDFEMAEGIVLSTGRLKSLEGPNNNYSGVVGPSGTIPTEDSDLESLVGDVRSVSVLEFDFVPVGNTVQFRYVFGSEEYAEYVNSTFNDVFGFFISGPGISGNQNIALLPTTTTSSNIVSINNVNDGGRSYDLHNCPPGNKPSNSDYYINIPGIFFPDYELNCPETTLSSAEQALMQSMQLNGRTVVLTATCNVTPCETYHLKLAVGNVGDQSFQSAVFLEARSFDVGDHLVNYGNNMEGMDIVYRGCENNSFVVSRTSPDAEPLTVHLVYSGTATNGVDVQTLTNGSLPTSVTIPANQQSATVFYKLVSPPTGTKYLDISSTCPCGGDLITKRIWIYDRSPDDNLQVVASPACPGVNNGRIKVTGGTGGSGSFESSLNGGAWRSSFLDYTNLAPATYTLQVRDSGSCNLVTRVVVVETVNANAGSDQSSCSDVFTMSAQALNPGETGQWTVISGAATIANSASPTTTVAVTTSPATLRWRLIASGCTADATVTLTVSPPPQLTSPLTPPAICSGDTFSYAATSDVAGTTYAWTRAAVSGISNAAGSGSDGSISEVLTNTTTAPVTVTYALTLTAGSCISTQNVEVVVNPMPLLSSPLTPPAICSGSTFSYTATSATSGTSFTWTRAAVSGISNAAGSGSDGSISEVLTNTTANPISVTYKVTLTANGCPSTQNVTVTVNPMPALTSLLTPPAICSGSSFSYTATSATAGTGFTWTRSVVSGISNAAGIGSDGSISEVLTNTTANPISVTYKVTLTANGCPNTQDVVVVVNPTPLLTSSLMPAAVCSSSPFVYEASSATVGTTYAWTRAAVSGISNAAGSGAGKDISETLINTTNAPVSVTYVFTLTANGCPNTQNVVVVVNPAPVPTISGKLAPCAGSTEVYITEAGMSSYLWEVDGGSITAGQGTGTLTVLWGSAGSGSLSVSYVSSLGCAASQPTSQAVDINSVPQPTVSGEIVVWSGSSPLYATEAGMSAYVWTVVGGTITSGQGTSSIRVTWGSAGSGSLSVSYVTPAGCPTGMVTPYAVAIKPAELAFSFSPLSVDEGSSATATLCLPSGTAAPAGGIVVNLLKEVASTSSEADYALSGGGISSDKLPASILISGGSSCVSFTVAALTDNILEGVDETLEIRAFNADIAATSATLTIKDKTPGDIIVRLEVPASKKIPEDSGTDAVFVIGFSDPAVSSTTDVRIRFTLSGTAQPGVDYVDILREVILPASHNSVEVHITPLNNFLVERSRTLILSLTEVEKQ